MVTEYDKAIAAFLSSLLGLLLAFNVPVEWLNPTTVAAITPFITLVVTWLVPNKAPNTTPSSTPDPSSPEG